MQLAAAFSTLRLSPSVFPPFFSCFKCTLTISRQQKLYKYFDWNLFCDDGNDDGQDVIESVLRHLFCLVQILITTSERKEQKTDLLFILLLFFYSFCDKNASFLL